MEIDNEQLQKIWVRNLRIILVLNIIGSGAYCLSYLMWGLMLPSMQAMYQTGEFQLPGELTVAFEQMLFTPRSFYLCNTLLYAASLAGVIMMWKLRKTGFHLYTIALMLVLVVTVLFLGKEQLHLGNLMMTLLFVTYYFIALRRIGVFTRDVDNQSDDDAESESDTENENDNT